MRSILSMALLGTAAAKVAVLLPFYNYPSFDASGNLDASWLDLFTAADAHTDLHFYVVINPADGPSNYATNADWVTALDKLNTRKNVQTLGYVATGRCAQTSPTLSTMEADIANWATWSTTTTSTGWGSPSSGSTWNISISGVFFDETATANSADGSVLSCYQTLKSYADSQFKASGRPASQYSVIFNPGAAVQDSMKTLFTLGDSVVNSETCYTDVIYEDAECGLAGQAVSWTPFTAALMRSTPTAFLPSDSSLWPKTSVLIHGFNAVAGSSKPTDNATLADAIKSVVERGVHSLYFTTKGWNSFADAPADIITVTQDIANAA